ncbi:MAG: hypothetical protein G3I10_00050 [Ferrovum sp.]|nr:hypothetical protein [Ferrovum sp.]
MKSAKHTLPLLLTTLPFFLAGCEHGSAPSENAASAASAAAPAAVVAPPEPPVPASTAILALASPDTLSAATLGGVCSIDGVSGVGVLAAGKAFTISKANGVELKGWAITADKRDPGTIDIVLKGNQVYSGAATTGQPRPDIAKAYGGTALDHTGFLVNVDTNVVAAGTYDVLILEPSSTPVSICDTHKQVIVGD